MKKIIGWIVTAVVLLIVFPWLTVVFAGSAGMAICFILFFAVNPLFSIVSGILASRNIRRMWFLPLAVAGLYIFGTWMLFDMGEMAFLLYGGVYLAIGIIVMLLSKIIRKIS